jgi:hypothetical protein
MHTFRDNAGNVWSLSITVAAVKRVRGLIGVDLFALVENGFEKLGKLVSDPVDLADVLYCLLKEECDPRRMSDEDFGRGLAGDVIGLAADAFVDELIDFFPDARARANLTKLIETGRKVKDRLLARAETLIETIDPDSEASRLIGSSGNSPASSDSTPDLSLFVN